MQRVVQELLITVNQRVQLMRKGKDHMKIRLINDFCPSFINPDFLKNCLTVGTVAITTGIMMDFCMPTVGALTDVATKFSGFTV